MPVHGGTGRADAAPHWRPALVRLRELQAPGRDHGAARGRRVRVGLLAGLVPGGAHQHDPRGRLYRGIAAPPARPQSPPPRQPGYRSVGNGAHHHHGWPPAPVRAVLPRHQDGRDLRHCAGRPGHDPAHAAGAAPGVQAQQLPLVEPLGLPLRRPENGGRHILPGLDLRDLVERRRHGSGRLLCRGMPGPSSRCQDRPHRGRPVRGVHLHRHGGGLRRGPRRVTQDRGPADPLHQLRRPHLRQRRLGEVPDRCPARVRAAAVGAERHHGCRPVPVPCGRGPHAAPLVRAQETSTTCRTGPCSST